MAGLQPEAPADSGQDTEPQIDRAEELRAQWGVNSGDLWILGEVVTCPKCGGMNDL